MTTKLKWSEHCAEFFRRKGIQPNPQFEKAFETPKPKGMYAHVRRAFDKLEDEVLVAMARDWTSAEDAKEYAALYEELCAIEEKYNARIRRRADD